MEALCRGADPHRPCGLIWERSRAGFSEPGLVLTPPSVASDTDDGLLTATEAARLMLSADWVILSACDTASALARGFLNAGTDAPLASH